MSEDEETGQREEPSDWWKNQTKMMTMGRVPSEDDAPTDVENEADYWRGRYKESEKTIMALQKQLKDLQFHQSSALMSEDTTAEDLLTRIWNRGIEAIGAFAFILFLLQVAELGIRSLTLLGQVAGAVTFVAVYEAYVRPQLNK
ncbi:hypothetical protein HWV23_14030 [Natronomonas halophila]|uniref:hypothetical protein n=1 Tax=Natronomonas halophila TaxID=2747817 RepID=UPI0015B40586|nr:hypothetical protein [Natronomonas halophila]QLD86797.1 hypothetical protein HWV23_14030 [Natronomonas halophila]